MVAEFHVVVRRGRCGTRQTERRFAEEVDDLISNFAIKGFQDARLIQHDAREGLPGELVQPLIVRNVDAVAQILRALADCDRHAKLHALGGSLRGYGERRENQHHAALCLDDLACPFELDRGLAEPAVGKDRRPPLRQRPAHNVLLEPVELRVQLVERYLQTCGVERLRTLSRDKCFVIDHFYSPFREK